MDRAIVTPVPGTTRDILREELILAGRRVRLVDTAGLRSGAKEPVEKMGIDRAEAEASRVDVICLIGAADEGLTAEDRRFLEYLPKEKIWWVWNKIDRTPTGGPTSILEPSFRVSALRGDGVRELREAFGVAAADRSQIASDGGIANDRQKELLDLFIASIEKGKAEWRQGTSPEFVAFELRAAHRALSRLVGKDEGIEDILNEIFSRFCIGK
jgi:tRNA modification GTPase